jgi:hypothetical protein
MDSFKNFAVSFVAVAPSPPATGTTVTVTAGHGARFPTPPFNGTIWPKGVLPEPTNAEIVRVTAITGDVLTITRQQESTGARSVGVGDRIAAVITDKTLQDLAAGAPACLVLPYRPDTATHAENDPGTGLIRWNTADQLAATALYVDRLTADGFDAQMLMSKLRTGSRIWIQDQDMSALYQEWSLVAYESRADWFILRVTLRSVGGTGIMTPQAAPSTNRVSMIVLGWVP